MDSGFEESGAGAGAGVVAGSMRHPIEVQCSQTWTVAFAVSLVFTVVIGILLVLYCIMYRKHIKFLINGPPPITMTKNKSKLPLPSASSSMDKIDMEGSTESHIGEVSTVGGGTSMMTLANNTSMMTGAGATNETNLTSTVMNTNMSNMSMISQA